MRGENHREWDRKSKLGPDCQGPWVPWKGVRLFNHIFGGIFHTALKYKNIKQKSEKI